MTLQEISDAVMLKLTSEAGTNKFWNETVVKADINWLYRDTAETLECLKKHDTSTTTVISTARYVIPVIGNVSSVLRLFNLIYDDEPVNYYTIEELDSINRSWRSLGDGKPFGCFYERGDENIAITLVPPPSEAVGLDFDFAYLPIELIDSAIPIHPFESGTILFDGTMAMELAKPGGGRDLDRSDFWFTQFLSHFAGLSKHKGFSWTGFKSPEESSLSTRSVRLPSNYPKYSFEE